MSFRLLDERDINAIKGNLKGSVVRSDDVLPAEHNADVRVRSKNLLSYPYYPFSAEKVGVTITGNEDGSITLNGTSNASWNIGFFGSELATTTLPKGIYTFSLKNGDAEKCYLVVGGQSSNVEYKFGTEITFDLKEEGNIGYCLLQIKAGVTFDNMTVYPMLEEGNTATEYTPYVDPASVTVTRCGKNLFDISRHIKKTATSNGITVDVLDDGCIYVHGTPIDNTTSTTVTLSHSQEVDVFPKGTYVYSNNPIIDDENVYCFPQANKPTNKAWLLNINKTATYVPEEFCMDRFVVYVKEGTTKAVNAKFYLQVEAGEKSSEYERYKDILTFTPNTDGSCDVKTISPSMTLLTDKAGAIIDCEYNRDANAVINKLTNAIIELGGTV